MEVVGNCKLTIIISSMHSMHYMHYKNFFYHYLSILLYHLPFVRLFFFVYIQILHNRILPYYIYSYIPQTDNQSLQHRSVMNCPYFRDIGTTAWTVDMAVLQNAIPPSIQWLSIKYLKFFNNHPPLFPIR